MILLSVDFNSCNSRIDSGSYLSNPEMIAIRLQIEPDRYEAAIRWLRDLLWDGVFSLTVSQCSCVRRYSNDVKNRDLKPLL